MEAAEDKIAALEEEKHCAAREGIHTYLDGWDIDNWVGAAAVLFHMGQAGFKTLHHYLGTLAKHSVYKVEIVGTILGTHLISEERRAVGLA